MRGPDKQKTERARSLRKVENDAEEALWFELRARRLDGFKFVRQLPIGPYFADFACRQVNLVVEVDGSQHANNRHDARRDDYMVTNGWSVARFWNGCVLQDRERVLETIVEIMESDSSKRSDRLISPLFRLEGVIPTDEQVNLVEFSKSESIGGLHTVSKVLPRLWHL